MRFVVLPVDGRPPAGAANQAFLLTDNWDDWFTFSTQYYLSYVDEDGSEHGIGHVKIGQFGQSSGRPAIPDEFDELSAEFFSLGQGPGYYEALTALGDEIRESILLGLRDFAYDATVFGRAVDERVATVSLLRGMSSSEVEGQLRRMAHGGARLSEFRFEYRLPLDAPSQASRMALAFAVEPESNPPTNIHVVIGRNGVGKTRMLGLMTSALVDEKAPPKIVGEYEFEASDEQGRFANLVSVSFSAFDEAEPLPATRRRGVRYTYVGLKTQRQLDDDRTTTTKPPSTLSREFGESVDECTTGVRLRRWRRALQALEGDPIFAESNVSQLAQRRGGDIRKDAQALFKNLSAGHKIVLYSITRLVESVEERSLVLLDEPEAHLHPPLLSAFIRALSDLLVDRNGVALIATHSPVVLQEVPSRCVWKLRRAGRVVNAERPEIETFGENVGILTREVFGLEVSQSGFHRLLQDAAEEGLSYEGILSRFGGALGTEAKGLAQALVAVRDARAAR